MNDAPLVDNRLQPAASAMELQFRAVAARGKRRGIRLERIFWEVLTATASAEGKTMGDLVATTHDRLPPGGNLSSALRIVGARWLRERLDSYVRATLQENLFAILQACPSPAFALSEDKRIVHYNLPFLNFVQASFVGVERSEVMRGLRLSLDTQLETLLAQLYAHPAEPVGTGFVLGVAERRVRGQLKATLAPSPDKVTVFAFVT
ncbi:MAG: ribbon-helix-helix domain-containing protein [Rhizobiaceae bacterium]|nr:ribbon-helix-helix domain-containing protein [Rhizobiaceae bacterium]